MKTTVTTYKSSGKWYDTFEITLPDTFKVFDKPEISQWLIDNNPQCGRMDFTFTIDDVPQLVIHSFRFLA